jgi:hypothetical protein
LGEELSLFLGSFEHTVTHLGGGADPLDLETTLVAVWEDGLAQNDGSLLGTWARAVDHDEVTLDETIVDPAAEWVDALLSGIHFSLAASGILGSVDHQDELVGLNTVEVTHLTSTCAGVLDVSWVP